MARGYGDHRWATFKQIEEKGWSFKTDEEGNSLGKGAGVSIEYFDLIDKTTGKKLDRSVLDGMTVEEKDEYFSKNVKPIRKYYRVFNGDVIEGIPAIEKMEINPMEKVDKVEELLDYWNDNEAKIVYGGTQAFYRPKTDEIHLPNRDKFFSMQEFYSTALHELGHSTGHANRLNRNIENLFGSPEYALEELRAEIASMFIEQDLEIQVDDEHKRNNSAYISAWKKEIKDNPNALFTAITDADKIAKYVAQKASVKKNEQKAEEKKEVEKYAIVVDKNAHDETVYKVYMASAIDIGDHTDIHPQDKKSVGKRLADNALCNVYNHSEIVPFGPLYQSFAIEDNKIRINFRYGEGLYLKEGTAQSFYIAGSGGGFVAADKVEIDGSSVLVSSEKIADPCYVRYAWSDYPVSTLYNSADLPASSFSTCE
jgi:antirestriction protein ArdC